METFSHVPPGFRFHPTDEELVDYYLRKKVASKRIDLDVIKDVDLYKIEPWDLQELCKIGTEEQNEWYFFSHKDKKYPTGTRTNRATKAGFWKATGRDKAIYTMNSLIGMRKTLVFYKGRAPNGQKSDWIMHEYRLETNENGPPQEEGWVVCRVFKKRMPTMRKIGEYDSPCWYEDQTSFMSELDSPRRPMSQQYTSFPHHQYPCKQELIDLLQINNKNIMLHHHHLLHDPPFLQLPQLESPKITHALATMNCDSQMLPYGIGNLEQNTNQPQILNSVYTTNNNNSGDHVADQLTDWRVLDKFVASQLSHDELHHNQEVSKGTNFSNDVAYANQSKSDHEIVQEYASTLTSSSEINLWK